MAKYSNPFSNTISTSTGNNPFVVTTSTSQSAIVVDNSGCTVIEKLVLKDEKTGNKWSIKISDGELIAEPLELSDKREYKLNKILK